MLSIKLNPENERSFFCKGEKRKASVYGVLVDGENGGRRGRRQSGQGGSFFLDVSATGYQGTQHVLG